MKTPQTVETIKSWPTSRTSKFMKFDDFGIWNCAVYKVIKLDFKNGEALDNICSKEVLGRDINWIAANVDYNYKNLEPFLQ